MTGMAVSASFIEFVLGQLEGVREVTHRRMFGGAGVYSGDTFFAVMDNDTLFFKVNDETRPRYEACGMPPFAPMADKPPMRGYYQVPLSVLEDADELAVWARESLTLSPARPSRRKATPSSASRRGTRRSTWSC
jgi:DNA transformation protein